MNKCCTPCGTNLEGKGREGGREGGERKGGIVGREREGREWKENKEKDQEREEGWDGERSKRHVKQKFNKDQFKEHM